MKFRAILNDKYDLEEIAQRKQSARPHHKTLIYFAVVWAVLNILAIIYITKSNYIYLLQCVLFVAIIILYADDIKKIINKCINKIRCKYKTKK